jgi:hypothetical protein
MENKGLFYQFEICSVLMIGVVCVGLGDGMDVVATLGKEFAIRR